MRNSDGEQQQPEPNYAAAVARLVDWTLQQGVRCPKLQPKYSPVFGWGLFCTADLQPDELMLEIPENLIIRSKLLLETEEYKDALSKCPGVLSSFDLLALFILHERAKGANSGWSAFIDVLPSAAHFLMPTMCQKFDAVLLPRSIRAHYERQRAELEQSVGRARAVWPHFNSRLPFDTDAYVWAWHCVNTRCVFVESPRNPLLDNTDGDQVALMPLFDLLNHSPQTRTECGYYKSCGTYRLRTCSGYSEGQQVYISYGPHSNARLLCEYGFVLDDNASNTYVVPLEQLIELAADAGVCLDEPHKQLLHEQITCRLFECQDEPPWMLMFALRICCMNDKELSNYQSVYADSSFLEDPRLGVLGARILNSCRARLQAEFEGVRASFPSAFSVQLEKIWTDDLNILQQTIGQLTALATPEAES